MLRNSFLGRSRILQVRLSNPGAATLLSKWEALIARYLGAIIIRIFGWPLAVGSRRTARIFFDRIPKRRNLIVLDAGCSHATYTFSMALEKKIDKVIGIDMNEHSIRDAMKIHQILNVPNVEFQKQDIVHTEFPDDSFDVVILGELIEHIEKPRALLTEIYRILRTDGVVIITTPWAESPERVHESAMRKAGEHVDEHLFDGYHHFWNGFSELEITNLLEERQFDVVQTTVLHLPRFLIKSHMAFFPMTYPLSFVLSHFSSNKAKIIVKARKK